MSRVVEVPLVAGGSVLVEVDELSEEPRLRGSAAPRVPPVLSEPLEEVLANLGPATAAVLTQLRLLAETPEQVEVEFAVKLTADARIMIARAGGEANFRILLRWAREAAGGSDGQPPAR